MAKKIVKINLKDNSVQDFYISDDKKKYFDKNPSKTGAANEIVDKTKTQKIYPNLVALPGELSNDLSNKENVVLFADKEYSHNTSDEFYNIIGSEEHFQINTGNVIGVIKYDNLEVNISSRFGDYFLQVLINYSDGFLELPDKGSISNDGDTSHWILYYMWKSALKKAYRLGLLKQYVKKSEQLIKIRGNININDYINRQARNGKYLCDYREQEYDNPVNRLINFAFKAIDSKGFLKSEKRLKDVFELAVKGRKISLREALSVKKVSNPYYNGYNKVIELSKNIITNKYGSLVGNNSNTNAFLFDVSMLFEFFIRKIIQQAGLKLLPKDDKQFKVNTGIFERHLYPDILIDRGNDTIDVFDVKYKHFRWEGESSGIKREDLFQLHTYIGNVSNSYTVERAGIIYPLNENEWETRFQEKNDKGVIKQDIKVSGKTIELWIVFFKVPNNLSDKSTETNNKLKKDYYKNIEGFQKIFDLTSSVIIQKK
jgi:5-methylcytosine-specific restriction endonuclease McrBC regulatory subunit McrC